MLHYAVYFPNLVMFKIIFSCLIAVTLTVLKIREKLECLAFTICHISRPRFSAMLKRYGSLFGPTVDGMFCADSTSFNLPLPDVFAEVN